MTKLEIESLTSHTKKLRVTSRQDLYDPDRQDHGLQNISSSVLTVLKVNIYLLSTSTVSESVLACVSKKK